MKIYVGKGLFRLLLVVFNGLFLMAAQPIELRNKQDARGLVELRGQLSQFGETVRNTGRSCRIAINSENQQHVLLLGLTGAGKSVLLNALAKVRFRVGKNLVEGSPYAVVPVNPVTEVGAGRSTTMLPVPHPIDNRIFWDCPGFQTTETVVQEIKDRYAINTLFSLGGPKHFCLVVSKSEIEAGYGVGFLEGLTSFLRTYIRGNLNTESASLVITKMEELDTADGLMESLLKNRVKGHDDAYTLLTSLKRFKRVYGVNRPTYAQVIKEEEIDLLPGREKILGNLTAGWSKNFGTAG